MTTGSPPPRKTLTLKLNKDSALAAQLQEKIAPLIKASEEAKPADEIDPKKLQFQKLMEALQWLYTTFPNCFSEDHPKPLKVRIEKDVLAHYPEDAAFARHHVRKALGFYVNCYKYRQAVLAETKRYDLDGNPVAEVTPENQLHAQEQQSKAEERYKEKLKAKWAARKARKKAWLERMAKKKAKEAKKKAEATNT